MYCYVVGLSQYGVKIDQFDSKLFRTIFRYERVIRKDFHLHTLRTLQDLDTNPSETDSAEDFVSDLNTSESLAVPLICLQRSVCLRYVSGERKHHGNRVLCCRDRVSFRSIRNDYAFLCCCCDIDVVNSDTSPTNDLETVCRVYNLFCYFRSTSDYEGIVLGYDLHQFLFGKTGVYVHIMLGSEHLQTIFCDRIAYKNFQSVFPPFEYVLYV